MSLKEKILEECENAKEASIGMASAKTEVKDIVLYELADDLMMNKRMIIKANKKDMEQSKGRIPEAMLKRLKVDEKKVGEMAAMVRSVAKLEDPSGKTLQKTELDEGLILEKVSVPIGVIACIFESRPEVTVQISAITIKSGNSVLLKGGSEAINTNKALADIIRKSIRDNKGIPEDAVQLLETREAVKEVLKMDEFIDLIIPRGSNRFVRYIQENTNIPVLGHSEGICHVYVDKDADMGKALRICIDSKCQYAAVCNAMETLLVHKAIAKRFLPKIAEEYRKKGVELRGDDKARKILKDIKKASEKDWKTEYTSLILSIKIVDDADEAIKHINKYGSGHTDSIVTENKVNALKFIGLVDSGSVMWNASTRFSDGYRYGFGAEVGISTNKIHARGPVGLEGLVIYKYVLKGDGHIVSEYSGEKGKKFKHKRLE
ncbi:glutamate-5-semialdehyde dehydrogenase [Candidatus Woesearchaeota archaeon]|nr:glutamate-5-semialdehyde dehydrogenase [Candidatus Woesearchaeota archaeon]